MKGFSAGYHIAETEKGGKKGFRFAAFACGVFLAALVLIMTVVARENAYEDMTIPNFSEAIETGNYEEALSIYRNVQDQVLAYNPDAHDSTYDEKIKLLSSMKIISIMNVLLNQLQVILIGHGSGANFLKKKKMKYVTVYVLFLKRSCKI